MPDFMQEARLNYLSGALWPFKIIIIYLSECAKYSRGKKYQCNCYIKNFFKSAVFRPTSLLVPAGDGKLHMKEPHQ